MKKPSRLKRKSIMTVSEFRSRFGDEVQCGEHLTAQRWPNGFVCPRCGGRSRGYMASRRVHECAGCGYQSSVTAGTIFHKTRTPLSSWFCAIYRMSQDKKGISALQLSKEIGVSYPTAWLMQHKIRKAMADRDQGYQLKGLIEVDEGYVGGAEQGKAQKGRGAKTKSVVAVAVERRAPGQQGEKPIPGFAALAVIPNAAARSLHGFLHAKVQPGSQVMSDGWRGYQGLERHGFQHTATPGTEIRRPLIDSFLGCTLPCPTGSAFCWAPTTKSNRNTSNATWPNSITGSTAALWRPICFSAWCGLVSPPTLSSTRIATFSGQRLAPLVGTLSAKT